MSKSGSGVEMEERFKRRNYSRVLIKLSGEALCKTGGFGIDSEAVDYICEEIAACLRLGKEVAIVVGGGNLIRGNIFSAQTAISRSTADYMGMLATVINGLALQDKLEAMGFETRLMSAIHAHQVAEPFIRRRATRHLEKGRIIILVGGTGNPYFSTDTQAALRAQEIGAGAFLKATKVDGVYSEDPLKNPQAKRFEFLTYEDFLKLRLGVMDETAVRLCAETKTPIIVFDFARRGNLAAVTSGQKVGTIIA
ncbi:MAG: UMP kinase [Planctomycetota bacterium]|nr:UMP kinase [Planctomycetota bacterium]